MPGLPASIDPAHAALLSALADQTKLIHRLMARVEALEGRGTGSQNSTGGPVDTPHVAQNGTSPGISSSDEHCKFGDRCTRPGCWYQHSNPPRAESSSTEAPRPGAPMPKKSCHKGMACTRPNCRYEHPAGWGSSGATSEPPSQPETNTWGPSEPHSQPKPKKPCHKGTSCTYPNCRYEHPAGWDSAGATSESPSQPETNTWGPSAPHSQPNPKKSCRNGVSCTRADCRFEHPAGWDPSGTSSKPPSQLETNTWGPPEEANTWGPSEPQSQPDTSAWGPSEDSGNGWGDGANLSSWADTSNNNDWGTGNTASNEWGPTTDNTWGTTGSQGWGSSARTTQGEPANSGRGAPSGSGARPASVMSGSTATRTTSSSKGKKKKNPRAQQREAEKQERRKAKKAEGLAAEPDATSADATSNQSTPADMPADQSTSAEAAPDQSAFADTPSNEWDTPSDQPTPADTFTDQPAPADALSNEWDTPSDQPTPADTLPGQPASADTPSNEWDTPPYQPTSADTLPDQPAPADIPANESIPALPEESDHEDQPSAPDEATDVIPTPEEITDFQDTPPLEPSTPPPALSSSESDEPETPSRLVWSDEPVTVDFADTPSGNYLGSESPVHQPYDSSVPEFTLDEEAENRLNNLEESEAQPSLDDTPSAIYGSWDNVQPSAADWGFDTSEFDTPPEADKKPETRKKSSKSKGKKKAVEEARASFNYQPGDIGAPGSASKSTPEEAKSKSSDQSTPALPAVTATPDPPQGVPPEEIPDWLLGVDEDPHAALGISRPTTPEPSTSSGPPRLGPSKAAGPPKISQLAGSDFPAPGQAISVVKLAAKTTPAPKPTIRARTTGWKIIPNADASNAGGNGTNNNSKAKGGSSKNTNRRKQAASKSQDK